MSAFDEIERAGQEPAGHLIGDFDYLNASGRSEAARVRSLIDAWLVRYPEANRPAMIRRLRSRDNTLHRSAFFELFLHELFVHKGFTIVSIEPQLPNGRSPDFLVATSNGDQFYLEATLASGMGTIEAGADRRMREALQAIDDVLSPDFFLHLHTRGTPSRPIAVKRLRQLVQRFVDNLDYAAAARAIEAGAPIIQVWQHEEHGMRFMIHPVPKNVRQTDGRAIGGRMLPGGIIRPHEAIRSAVQDKASRYGELDLPLIIAVNALEDFVGPDDAIDALFGTLAVVVSENGLTRPQRNRDGAWHGLVGPVHTRSSAVFFVERLSPWSIAQRTARMILNPWARNPVAQVPSDIEIRHVTENRLMTQPGQSLREIFDLPEGWPE